MPATAATATPVPASVLSHCDENRLLQPLQTALRLVERTFGAASQVRVAVEPDPETGEEHLVVDVTTKLPVDEAVARKQEYTRQWIQAVPPEVIGKIRLVLDIG